MNSDFILYPKPAIRKSMGLLPILPVPVNLLKLFNFNIFVIKS